ncbi:MAG: hypothetical protein AAF513_20585, partial [Pseudomonadota bacterium]
FRAAHSLQNIRVNTTALAAWMDDDVDATYRLANYLERVLNDTDLASQIDTQLSTAASSADAITASLEDIVSGQATGDIESVRLAYQALADLIVDVAVLAGVNLGFNNQDGD